MHTAQVTGSDTIRVTDESLLNRAAHPLLPISATVIERCEEFAECVTLTVKAHETILSWEPGQFFMVSMPGVGEVPLSVSGWGPDDTSMQFTILAVGPVTRRLCDQPEGTTIGIRGPFGTGWPLEALSGHDVLLIAGGLGMAPLRPVVLSIIERPMSAASLTILCGARTPSSLLFGCDLGEWERTAGVSVTSVVERPCRTWQGRQGIVTDLIGEAEFSPSYTVAFICGPEEMMRTSARMLEDQGVPVDQIYLAMERNMQCGVGWCGRCQLGPLLICRDGPVVSFDRVGELLTIPRV